MKARRWLFLLGFVSLGSCGVMPEIVRERAAYDFHCREENITVENVSGGTYVATCIDGQEAIYNCIETGLDDATCVRER